MGELIYTVEEPDWSALDWIRPGIRGTVLYRASRRPAFRAHDSTILFWCKNKWNWASSRTMKTFESDPSD